MDRLSSAHSDTLRQGTVVAPRRCETQKQEEKRRRPRGRQPARPRRDSNGEDYIPTVFDKFRPMSRWIGALSTWGLWDTAEMVGPNAWHSNTASVISIAKENELRISLDV